MKLRKQDLLLYAVTDDSWVATSSLARQVEEAIKGGATMVQFREKNPNNEKIEEEARRIQEICRKYHVPFLVNDYVELAYNIDADGVHVGQSDTSVEVARALLGPDKIIGVTAKTVEQAQAAQKAGADYLGSGAVFGTETKMDTKKLDHDILDEICASVTIPVVAIGGINRSNIMELKGRKMAGVAVVSGIFDNSDIESATRELRTQVEQIIK